MGKAEVVVATRIVFVLAMTALTVEADACRSLGSSPSWTPLVPRPPLSQPMHLDPLPPASSPQLTAMILLGG